MECLDDTGQITRLEPLYAFARQKEKQVLELQGQRDACANALRVAINTVECASLAVQTGHELPWYKMAKKALALIAS